jgi:hypothetical protein
MNALLADTVLIVHAAVVLFVVGGQVLILIGWWRGWHWTRAFTWRVIHLLVIGLVVVQSWIGAVCPLTALENRLRIGAGESVYVDGFIAAWVQRILFYNAPPMAFVVVYTAFALLVIASFVWNRPQRNVGWKDGSKNAK